MAHPVASSRSLEFFLDLGNLSSSVDGNVVVPPNNEEYWKSKGVGTFTGWEFTIRNAVQLEVDEGSTEVGDIYWNTVTCGLENGPEPLFDFKVFVRGYTETITETPVYGPPDPDTGVAPVIDSIWNGVRTYPTTEINECKIANAQKRIPSLWPAEFGPAKQEWADTVFGSGETRQYSTVVAPRRFEGITLYGTDAPWTNDEFAAIVGIAEGEARCVGFVENKDVLEVNFMPPGDFYVAADTLVAYTRTPNDRVEPLVSDNDGTCGRIFPFEQLAGRVTFPEELPRSTPQNPIAVGTTYLQRENPSGEFAIPFAGFIGRHLWAYTGIESVDNDGLPWRDQNGEIIEDFRWQRSRRPELMSGYNYTLVFDEAVFEYVQRLGGPNTPEIHVRNPAATGGWFPTDPYDPDANPPIYPIDTIPTFVPDERESVDVEYQVTVSGGAPTTTIVIRQTVLAPTRNWGKMLTALLKRSYYYNGISRSYATVPNYCNTTDNPTDPYCVETGQS